MSVFNIYLFWKIYKGIRKQLTYINPQFLQAKYEFYSYNLKMIHLCLFIFLLTIILEGIYKMFSNYSSMHNLKWIIKLLNESVPLSVYIFLILYLQPAEKETNEDSSYSNELDSRTNNTTNRLEI